MPRISYRCPIGQLKLLADFREITVTTTHLFPGRTKLEGFTNNATINRIIERMGRVITRLPQLGHRYY